MPAELDYNVGPWLGMLGNHSNITLGMASLINLLDKFHFEAPLTSQNPSIWLRPLQLAEGPGLQHL